MPPRADEPPRRGSEPRRGASRATDDAGTGDRGFGGISDARAYTPRGRTVREGAERVRGADPFAPSLQVLDGGAPVADRRRGGAEQQETAARRRSGTAADPPVPTPVVRRRSGGPRPAAGAVPDAADGADAPVAPDRRTARDRTARDRTARDRTARDRASRDPAARERSAEEPTGKEPTAKEPTARELTARDRAARSRQDGGRGGAGRTGAGPARTPGGRPAPDGRQSTLRRPAEPAPVPQAPPLADSRRRLRVGTVVALALFAIIAGRLVALQIVNTPAYAASLNEQRKNRLATVALPAPRGAIYDRNNQVLARSIEARYVYADPKEVKDPEAAAEQLWRRLGVSKSELLPKLRKHTRPGGGDARFEYLKRGVSVSVADAIDALQLPGIGTHRDERRVVPGYDLAVNLLGFTGSDLQGLEGMEARYNDVLRGRDGQRVYERGNPDVDKGRFAKEIPGGYRHEVKAQPGTSLVLTIDSDLQYVVQKTLDQRMRQVKATYGGAVVLDVKTGEVLAQASYPSYNPAQPQDSKPADRQDVASSVVVDPGSVHKALIFGAALQEGLIKPDSTIPMAPAVELGGEKFADHVPFDAGTKVPLPQLLAMSSNVGTIKIGQLLGKERIYEYQRRFGLGRQTGEGVSGEAPGRLLAPQDWSGSSEGSVPIGHSVDATLIQMAAAYAAIANDGTYVQPHLIRETVAADGVRTPASPPVTRSVLRPDVARELRTMMEAVVQLPQGTGHFAKLDNYRVAGKTGTGKRVVQGSYASSNVSSFIGMAPADNPRFVVAVLGDSMGGTGGEVGGPAFKDMMTFTLAHYKVPPTGAKPPNFRVVP